MTNEEKMNEQLSALADLLKMEFTPEELEKIEKAYDEFIQSGSVRIPETE